MWLPPGATGDLLKSGVYIGSSLLGVLAGKRVFGEYAAEPPCLSKNKRRKIRKYC